MNDLLPDPADRRRLVLWLLFGVVLLVYASAANHEFLNIDDDLYVTQNWRVQEGLSWENVKWALVALEAGFWHPLTWLTHMADCQFYGLTPRGHHVTNLVIHAVNVGVLFWVLRQMTGALWCSAVVAGMFGLHPLNVESVAWVAERKNVLSTLFWLLTMWGYLRYVRKPSWGRYGAMMGVFVVGLMAKPMLVTLPCVLLLLDYWPLRRWEGWGEFREKWRGLVLEKVPMLVPVGVVSVLAVEAQERIGALTSLEGLPVGVRVGNAVVSYVQYLRKMVWPVDLAVFYPHPGQQLSVWWVVVSCVVLVGITGVVLWRGSRSRYLVVGWLWYLGTMFPVSGVVQVGGHAMADRYAYVPMIGVFVMVVWSVAQEWRWSRNWLIFLALLVLVDLSLAARVQLGHWSSSRVLFEQTLRVTSRNYVAHNLIGIELKAEGQLDSAIQHLHAAIRIAPDYSEAQNNLGVALLAQGKLDEAAQHFSKSLAGYKRPPEAHNNLGIVFLRKGELDEARKQFSQAIAIDPNYSKVYTSMGLVYAAQKRFEEAIGWYQQALDITPNLYSGHNNLGVALMEMERFDEAIDYFSRAMEINPDNPEAYTNLGVVLAKSGRMEEAETYLSAALQFQPDFAPAYYYLALMRTSQGRIEEAVQMYREALRHRPGYQAARQNLDQLLSQNSP